MSKNRTNETGPRLRDVMDVRPSKDIPRHIRGLAANIRTLLDQIAEELPRTNESAAVANLGRETVLQLNRLADAYPRSIETIAWCTRNLFEINLVLRFILQNEANLNLWLGQMAGDEMQMLEGVLTLAADPMRPEVGALKYRLSEIDQICRKHGIDPTKPIRVDKLADVAGVRAEYVGLYKLFSKYVHPTSWLINSPQDARDNPDYLNIFLAHAQIYSGDTLTRLQGWSGTKPVVRAS